MRQYAACDKPLACHASICLPQSIFAMRPLSAESLSMPGSETEIQMVRLNAYASSDAETLRTGNSTCDP
jgi:hypothetical protein